MAKPLLKKNRRVCSTRQGEKDTKHTTIIMKTTYVDPETEKWPVDRTDTHTCRSDLTYDNDRTVRAYRQARRSIDNGAGRLAICMENHEMDLHLKPQLQSEFQIQGLNVKGNIVKLLEETSEMIFMTWVGSREGFLNTPPAPAPPQKTIKGKVSQFDQVKIKNTFSSKDRITRTKSKKARRRKFAVHLTKDSH